MSLRFEKKEKAPQTSTDITSVSMAMWRKRRLLVSGSGPCEESRRDGDRERQTERKRVSEIL